jgi:hypothetical protein
MEITLKMKVTKTKDLGGGHLIESGGATWDETETSIRDRYPTRNGGLNPHSSSEIPLGDVAELVVFAADEDLLGAKELAGILCAVSASLQRKI